MKLVTFVAQGVERWGALLGGSAKALDLGAALASRGLDAPRSLLAFVERSAELETVVRACVAEADAGGAPAAHLFDAASSRLLAPLPRPPSMRDGYAFRQHVATARKNRGLEMIPEFDQFPVFYFTNHQAVTGPGDVEVEPLHLDRLDFELEAAIVIGREGRNLTAADADAHVLGLTIMNDWSARELQLQEMKLSLGPAKGKDFATSLGPWLVTLDELESARVAGPSGSAWDLTMTARVNGVEVSRGNLRDMTWTFAQIVERASYGVTLHPGDVIGSGTVGTGCFLELNGSKLTHDQWLHPGDEVELSIDRLGTLANRIVRAR